MPFHVILEDGKVPWMETLDALKTQGFVPGDRYVSQDHRVVDEEGNPAGKYIGWLGPENRNIWVSDRAWSDKRDWHLKPGPELHMILHMTIKDGKTVIWDVEFRPLVALMAEGWERDWKELDVGIDSWDVQNVETKQPLRDERFDVWVRGGKKIYVGTSIHAEGTKMRVVVS